MKIIVDMSSLMWTALLAGKDVEAQTAVREDGKVLSINTAAYGYENAVNMLVKSMDENQATPKDLILVVEGQQSKSPRQNIYAGYKAGDSKVPEQYIQFNLLKEKLLATFRGLGSIAVTQPFVEGDDVIAYISQHMEEDCVIQTGDNDLAVLNGTNAQGAKVVVRVGGEYAKNKYGDFSFSLITLYKSLVGDTSDKIKGVQGFGPKSFEDLLATHGEANCKVILNFLATGKLDKLAEVAERKQCKLLQKIVDNWQSAVTSYKLALIHPEWVNTVKRPLQWMPGMVSKCDDERLAHWASNSKLVVASNYETCLKHFQLALAETEFVTIDFETTTPDESDEWLATRGTPKGVDVIASRIVSMGINFGDNLQHSYYISVDHKDTDNCTMEQLVEFIKSVPADKHIVAHNAAGFELPVAYNNFHHMMPDTGWRGFIPNMVDTRIAASFWDENQPSHGLKNLSKLLLEYEQETFDEVTTIDGVSHKMDELTAKHVLSYGVDDVYTTAALWNFFKLFMQLEHTYKPFLELEQKPTYLSALAYVQGLEIDIPRLRDLTAEDEALHAKCWGVVESYLIDKGWDGVTCPVFEDLSPANIKQAVEIVTGQGLKTMVRTASKLACLIEELDHESAGALAALIKDDRVDLVNKMVASHYQGKPQFNVGSPKQLNNLLYGVMGLPIRLRNKATEAMRAKNIREGSPRTDDSAVEMAIKFGDAKGREVEVLKSLLEMKSCNTRKGLYWTAIPNHIHWKTGRLHPELRQSATNTRRWTSSHINIQQLEGKPDGVRSVIKGGAGRAFVSLDFSSQEVRQVASYTKDANLLSCYIGDNKRDTHSIVGARVAGVPYKEFMGMRSSSDEATATKAAGIRKISKVVLFSVLYSAAAPKIAETLGISEPEAQTYIDAIFQEFPDVKKWKQESETMADTQGYVTIAGGTRRHLAKLVTSEDKWEASKALRQAGNARIQGAGANQVKTVMGKVWDSNLLDTTSLVWNFVVHDECCFSVAHQDGLKIIKDIHKIMTYDFLGNVPSESSVGLGPNYGQLIELERPFAKLGVQFDDNIVQETLDKLLQ